MREVVKTTKILVIEGDHTNFQVRKCIAQALTQGALIELIHAGDVTEGLRMIDRLSPDAIIFSEDDDVEKDFLLDSLGYEHPPLILQTIDATQFEKKQSLEQNIMYVPFYDTLEGMHQVLVLAAALGERFDGVKVSRALH